MNVLQRLWLVHRLRSQFYDWDRKRLEQHQAQKVMELLLFAHAHSPFYQRALKSANLDAVSPFTNRAHWDQLVPIMDKVGMNAHFAAINTVGLVREELVKYRQQQEQEGHMRLYNAEYSVGLSSGTSGNKGLTVLSKKEQQLYGCLLFARSGLPRRLRKRRILFALRLNNPAFQAVRSFGVTLVYVDYTVPVTQLIAKINEERLNIVAGPPSLLRLLAARASEIRGSIDAVVSYAEVLDDHAKTQIENAFGCRVVEIYQASEGFLASTCRNGHLHLHEDILFFETLASQDPLGSGQEFLLTDLYRRTQPMIRYKLGDVLEVSPEPCSCGSCFRVVTRIHGRRDDVFFVRDRQGSLRHLFPDYIRRAIIHSSDQILEYQVFQKDPSHMEIRLVLEPHTDRRVVEQAVSGQLAMWLEKLDADLPHISFSEQSPQLDPTSKKMIRVRRLYQEPN